MKLKNSEAKVQCDCYSTQWYKRRARIQFISQVWMQTVIAANVFKLVTVTKLQEFEGIVAALCDVIWGQTTRKFFHYTLLLIVMGIAFSLATNSSEEALFIFQMKFTTILRNINTVIVKQGIHTNIFTFSLHNCGFFF